MRGSGSFGGHSGFGCPWFVEALCVRSAGNTKTKIVTLDLSEPIALDMVKGGNVTAIAADQAYELGRRPIKNHRPEPKPPYGPTCRPHLSD